MEKYPDYTPFILRFSESMHRQNPVRVKGGKTRSSSSPAPNTAKIIKSISTGYIFYKSFAYNDKIPVHYRIVLKDGSLSKSLRYAFLQTCGLTISAALSAKELVFSLKDSGDINRINSLLKYSSNSNFRASVSHFEDISCILPSEKKITPAFGKVLIKIFPDIPKDVLLNFFKYQLNTQCSFINIGGTTFVETTIDETKDKDLICTHSAVVSINSCHEIFLTEQYLRHEDLSINCIIPRNLEKQYPKAALIDSGVSGNSYLKEWEIKTESFVDGNNKNIHGTFVCGRMLKSGETFGGITFLNVEFISSQSKLDISAFEKNIRTVVRNYYKSIKIYNLSMGTNVCVEDVFSTTAQILDRLQYEFDVLFIISAGNKLPAENIEKRIVSPAESVHSLTVGSVSHTDTNLQKKYEPSLFTREGPGPNMFLKPDLSSFGGSHEKRFGKLKPVGVFSIGVRNELAEDIGTSHAAPLVTAKAARLYFKYSHAFKSPDMTKAIILHDAFLANPTRTHSLLTGYGIYDESISSNGTVIFMHRGICRPDMIVELSDIPVPPAMFDEDRVSGEIVITLVYKTFTSLDFANYYCMEKLDISLGYYKNDKWESVVTAKNIVGMPENKDMQELFGWQPVRIYFKNLHRTRMPETLKLRISQKRRDFHHKKRDIPYSLVISFIHKERNLYKSLLAAHEKYEDILDAASDLWKTC